MIGRMYDEARIDQQVKLGAFASHSYRAGRS
jgi:hypothetical protein